MSIKTKEEILKKLDAKQERLEKIITELKKKRERIANANISLYKKVVKLIKKTAPTFYDNINNCINFGLINNKEFEIGITNDEHKFLYIIWKNDDKSVYAELNAKHGEDANSIMIRLFKVVIVKIEENKIYYESIVLQIDAAIEETKKFAKLFEIPTEDKKNEQE